MALSKVLLETIACPLTRQALHEADQGMVREVVEKLAAGKMKSRGAVDFKLEEVSGLLLTEDGRYAYPVVGEIPNLLPASCILVKP